MNMKKIIFTFSLVLFLVSFSFQSQAQSTNCTPEQIEACKKICASKTVATTQVSQNNEAQPTCNSKKVASENSNFQTILAANLKKESKSKSSCNTPCLPSSCQKIESVKLTKKEKSSCTVTKSKTAMAVNNK